MNLPGVYDFWLDKFKDYQTCHVISDLHFADEDLRKGHPDRISDDDLVRAINSKVGKRDVLFILGDVGDISYLRKLRGYKILIMGNHDAGVENYKRQRIGKKFDDAIYQRDEALLEMKRLYPDCSYTISREYDVAHAPFTHWYVTADNNLCDMVIPGPLMLGEKLILSHEPIPNINWALNISGHDHQGIRLDQFHYNVCVDVMGPTPLNLNQFLKGGPTAHIQPLHRQVIDTATYKKTRRGGKKIWEVRK